MLPDENCSALVLTEAHPFYSRPFSQFVKTISNSPHIFPKAGNPSHFRGIISSFSCSYHLGVCIPIEQFSTETQNYNLNYNQPWFRLTSVLSILFFSSWVMKALWDITSKALSYYIIILINHYIVIIISIKYSLGASIKIKLPLDQTLWSWQDLEATCTFYIGRGVLYAITKQINI